MLEGITVQLQVKVKTGMDPFNYPVYEESYIDVHNVIVSPNLNDDIVSQTNLEGKKEVYILGIPKEDKNEWEDRKVKFFGHTYKTFGTPVQGIENMVPGPWHLKVMCERYE